MELTHIKEKIVVCQTRKYIEEEKENTNNDKINIQYRNVHVYQQN